jgi:hypothetical protein
MSDDVSLPEYYSDDVYVESRQPKSKKVLSLKLAFLTLISAVGYSLVGNTFAANVQLGTGRLEFGQGVLTSTACDSSVVVTPFATFANASGAAAKYKLTDIQLSGISTNCYGKDFVIKVYDSATATPLNLYQAGGSTNYNVLRVYDNNGTFTLADSGLTQSEISAVTGGFKVTLFNSASPAAVALAEAANVARITVESVPHDGTLSQSAMPSGSLFFTSPNQSIDYASNNAFALGTGDFTLELWAKLPSTQSNETFYDAGGNVNNSGSFAFWIENNLLLIRRNGLVGDITVPMDSAWRDGNYHHFAAVRGNGKYRIFVDGVLKVEAADSGHIIDRTTPTIGRLSAHLGYDLDGDLRNLRLVKGTALYSSNFTPPATPLAKVSGTLLLLLAQDSNNPYYDSSDNHFTPSNSSNLPVYRAP